MCLLVRDIGANYPDDKAQIDLDNWAEYEKVNPDIFASMYVFWCCKK